MPGLSDNRAPAPAASAPLSVVIQMARLGDFLQSTPLIRAVRQRHPENRVAVLVTPAQAPLARGCPWVDEVLQLEPAPLVELIQNRDLAPERKNAAWRQAIRGLSGLSVEHLYNLNLGPVGGLLGRCWPAAEAHGWRLHPSVDALHGEPWSPFIMAMAGKRELTRLHLADILSAYADPPERPADGLCYHPPLEAMTSAQKLLGAESPLVALQLGANSFLRRWPVEGFCELALQLVLHGFRPVLVGSAGEAALGKRLLARLGPAGERVIDLMGKTSLPQLGAVLSLCGLVVSADTGTLHLATAAGAKVLALFMGPAQVHETGPYGDGHLVLQARDHCGPCQEQAPVCQGLAPCRRLIEPKTVTQAALGLLRGDTAEQAVRGLEFKTGISPYVGRLSGLCQSYLPLRPAALAAEDCLALGLKQAGLALLYSGHRFSAQSLTAEVGRAGTGLLPGQKKKLGSLRDMLDQLPNGANSRGLEFLARLQGPKAPPRADRALNALRSTLDICLELGTAEGEKSET